VAAGSIPASPPCAFPADGHTAWANSKALALASVTRDTRFSGFGELVLDEKSGEPTGCLKEGAMSLVSRLLPPVTRPQQLQALQQGLKLAASLGITSFLNASGSRDEVSLYEELLARSALTARVTFALSAGRDAATCSRDLDLKQRLRGPMVRVDAVKFMLDGVIESHTAAMLEPYSDGFAGAGDLAWAPDAYRQAVAACDAAGFQILTHAIGDRAIRTALDAYAPLKRGRARIEHIESIHPADIPRFAALGVIASMEPIHADPGTVAVWSKAVGEKRLPYSFPWRALEQAGARLAFSSDWPASISLDPIRGIHNAVNRQTIYGQPPGGWLPQHRVSLESALRAYTIDAAYAAFEDDLKGSIQPGRLADFVVLSQDLFRIPPARIHETRVVTTVFDGKPIFQRPAQTR
jgi:predicted amidohydrolase YtcJ